MHFLLGLAALLVGVVIAVRRARAGWWVGLVIALAVVGAIFAILGFLRVTDAWGFTVMNVIGWVYVALCFMTGLAAVFVLERRGPNGEEQDAILGDTPFDGDTNDADDPQSRTTGGTGPWATASTVTLAEPAPAASTPSAAPVEGQVVADELAARESARDSAPASAPVAPQDGTAVVGADPDLAIPDADAESVDADADRDVRHAGDADDDRRSDGPQVRF